MYHQFIPQNSSRQITMNNKLSQILNYYQHLEYLKSQQPKDQSDELHELFQFEHNFRVSVFQSLYNEKHNCMIFWLSAYKLVRYDFGKEVMEEIEGSDDFDLMYIKVLDIGRTEKYLLLNENGIVIFSFLRERSEEKLQQKMKETQNMEIQNENQNDHPQKMQDESQSEMVESQQNTKPSFKINTIKCSIFRRNFHDIISQGIIEQPLKQGQNPKRKRRIRSFGSFIVRNLNMFEKSKNQEDKTCEKSDEKAFVLTQCSMACVQNLQLAVYELTVRRENETSLHKEEGNFCTILKGAYLQTLTISQVRFPNHKHYIQLAMSYIQIPFSTQQQSQKINPIQVTESNAKFTRPNLIFECERNYVTQNCGVNCFSLFCGTQAITHDMEPGEYRHFVFEFRFAINEKQCKFVENDALGSPFYEYPERVVMCPAKVYCLPLISFTSILCYINVTKTLSQSKSQQSLWQPSSYKFTTLSMKSDTKMQFSQIECKISNQQQQNNNKHTYRNILNEQNRKWHIRLEQKIIFSQMILIDLVKHYAIMMVREDKVKVRNELIPNHADEEEGSKKVNQQKIIVLNLRQHLPANQKRISAEYVLDDSPRYLRPYVQLNVDSIMQQNICISEDLTIQTEPAVINNSLHLAKTLNIVSSKLNNQSGKLKGYESRYEPVYLLPKAMIYYNMLSELFGKMGKLNGEKLGNQMQNKQGKQQKYNMNGMDSFFANVIDVLNM